MSIGFPQDQVMALRWIQDHISKFGGNRRKVTLFGNSSGAMMISVHIISPMSKGTTSLGAKNGRK